METDKISDSVQDDFDIKNTQNKWLNSLNEGEKFLAERGVLFEGDQTHLNSVKITHKDGKEVNIPVETILMGNNTLAIPSTKEAQKEFGASIPRQKRNY